MQNPFYVSSVLSLETLTEHSFAMKVSGWKCTVGFLMCVLWVHVKDGHSSDFGFDWLGS